MLQFSFGTAFLLGQPSQKQHGKGHRLWDPLPDSATRQLCDLGHVTQPLCASVFLTYKTGIMLTASEVVLRIK